MVGVQPRIMVSVLLWVPETTLPLNWRMEAPTILQASHPSATAWYWSIVMSLRFCASMNWSTSVTTLGVLPMMNTLVPEIKNFLRDVAVDAVDEGDHGNHRGHSDDHPQEGEHGAQLVGPKRQQGHTDGFSNIHDVGSSTVSQIQNQVLDL